VRPVLAVILGLLLAGCGASNVPAPVVSPPTGAGPSTVQAPSRVEPPPVPPEFDPGSVPRENADGRALVLEGDHEWTGDREAVAGPFRSLGKRPEAAICSWSVSDAATDAGGGAAGKFYPTVESGVDKVGDGVQRLVLEPGQTLTSVGCQPWVYYGP
jgi:hypothetical protein